MIDYIKSLLPRLHQFSKSLNDTSIFADVPWAFIDDDGDKVTYIFRRNNELLVSKRGEVTTGHWEYLSVMQSLLIEHANRKRMFNQGFVDNAVMALRKDGTEELFLLANQQLLPDLNIVGYLDQQFNNKAISTSGETSNKVTVELINPRRLVFIKTHRDKSLYSIYEVGNEVFDSKTGNLLEDGVFHTNSEFELHIENGIIRKIINGNGYIMIIVFVMITLGFIIALILSNSNQ